MESLARYSWPGNVRELQNIVERALILAGGSVVHGDDNLLQSGGVDFHCGSILSRMSSAITSSAHSTSKWVIHGKRGAAEILGINPSTLRSRMGKLGIKRPQRVRG